MIRKLLLIWQKVSRIGVDPALEARTAKRIILCNQIAISVGLLTVLHVGNFLPMRMPALAALNVLVSMCYLSIPLLNRAGFTRASRLVLTTFSSLDILVFALALGKATGYHLFFLPACFAPLILFDWEERKSLIYGVALNCLMLVGFEVAGNSASPLYAISPETTASMHIDSVATTLVIQILIVAYFLFGNRRAEKDLAKSVEAAKAADRAKSIFLANMSHEIRTPMNGILGLSHLLAKAERNPEKGESINAIQSSARDLLAIINEILDLSKIESGKVELENISFDLRKLIDNLRLLFATQADAKGLAFTVAIPPELPTRWVGDPVRLRQTLTNLLGNALKFTQDGGVTLELRWERSEEGPGRLCFEVLDTGAGIPEAARPRIFQAFSQADESTTRKFGGTGLGLHICKQIVEMMGGAIGFRSESGKGTCFHFWIPLEPEAEPTASTGTVNLDAPSIPSVSAADADAASDDRIHFDRDQRILVVDDHSINRRVMAGMLGDLGLKCDFAVDGQDALDIAAQKKYDIVIIDSHMPRLDGFACVREMRKREQGDSPAIIIGCTADAMAGTREKCLEAGMNDMITKPVLEEVLVEALDRWARKEPQGDSRQKEDGNEKAVVAAAAVADDGEWIDGNRLEKILRWMSTRDPSFLKLSLAEFEETFHKTCSLIRESCQQGKLGEAAGAAHALKGIAGMLAFKRCVEICQRLEAKEKEAEFIGWPELLLDLEACYEPSMAAFRRKAASLSLLNHEISSGNTPHGKLFSI